MDQSNVSPEVSWFCLGSLLLLDQRTSLSQCDMRNLELIDPLLTPLYNSGADLLPALP